MPDSLNPYEPPVSRTDTPLFDGVLRFSGTITETDYLQLLPRNASEGWVWFTLVVLSLTTVAPLLSLGVIFQISQGEYLSALGVVTFAVGMSAFLTYMQRNFGTVAVGKRKLRDNPDLLGQAEGEISASGMSFFDGHRRHWFGPALLMRSQFLKSGVRVGVDQDPFRYLALVGRIFENYSIEAGMRLRSQWAMAAVTNQPLDLESCLGAAPQDAVHYRFQTREWRSEQVGIMENVVSLISQTILLFLAIFSWDTYGRTLIVILGVVWIYSFGPQLVRYLTASAGDKAIEVPYIAWISSTELAYGNAAAAVRTPLSGMEKVVVEPDRLTMVLGRQTAYVMKTDLMDAQDWDRLCALCIEAAVARLRQSHSNALPSI